jgi:hypothetical protein
MSKLLPLSKNTQQPPDSKEGGPRIRYSFYNTIEKIVQPKEIFNP